MKYDISKTERLLWYKMALVTLKQSVLQVGTGAGADTVTVIRKLHGHDFDPWIPELDEEMPFDFKLWDKAEKLCAEDDLYREMLETHLLHYWHHYEAFVRKQQLARTGGKPEPLLYQSRLCNAYIAAKETQGLERERLAVPTVDDLVADLESRGLGWSLDNTGRLIEARVWDWPYVIGRYRPNATEPLTKMLAEAMYQVDWTRYPVKSPNEIDENKRRQN